jgi:hypothetical protein
MSDPATVDATVPTVTEKRSNLKPFTKETARAASVKAAQARREKRERERAALATVEAATVGATLEYPDALPMTKGPIRDTLRVMLRKLGADPPWKDGPEAAQLLRAVAELAAQEDRDAEARRQRLLAEAVKPKAPEPSSTAVEALAKVLRSLSPPVGASEPNERGTTAGPGDDDDGAAKGSDRA